MPLLVDIYELYLRAAVELRQITGLERDELHHLRILFGIQRSDLEQIRESLVSLN